MSKQVLQFITESSFWDSISVCPHLSQVLTTCDHSRYMLRQGENSPSVWGSIKPHPHSVPHMQLERCVFSRGTTLVLLHRTMTSFNMSNRTSWCFRMVIFNIKPYTNKLSGLVSLHQELSFPDCFTMPFWACQWWITQKKKRQKSSATMLTAYFRFCVTDTVH